MDTQRSAAKEHIKRTPVERWDYDSSPKMPKSDDHWFEERWKKQHKKTTVAS